MKILIISVFAFALASGAKNNTINREEEQPSNATTTTTEKTLYKLSDYEDSLYIQELLRAAKAAEMQAYLNSNVSPCSNFYEFACGNFRKFHASSSILQIIDEGHTARVESLLNTTSDSSPDAKLKLFFRSCVNVTQITRSYKAKLMSIIGEFGQMPVLSGNSNWNATSFDWIAMIAKMQRKYGKKALLSLNIAADFRDNRISCWYIGQPKLLLPSKSMYLGGGLGKLFKAAAADVVADRLQYFLDVPQKLAEQTAAEIIEFEVLLAKGMWDGRVDVEKMNLPTSTFYLQKKYAPIIDVKRFLRLTLGITQTNCMYEHVESYMENLHGFLTQIPKHVVANYLFFMLLNDQFLLPTKVSARAQKELCLRRVKKYFPKFIDNLIHRRSNTTQLESDFRMIFNSLRETLLEAFTSDRWEWLKPKARNSAIEKLGELRLEFNSHDEKILTHELKELNFTENDYVENAKRMQLLRGKQFIGLLNSPPKTIDSEIFVSSTPVYLLQQNVIQVPIALLLQNILWTHCFPMAIKFAQIGAMLGHALIHGFDDEARKFDKRGQQQNWWDLDTMAAFNEHKRCLAEQSRQFQFDSNYLHDDFLLSEIIADNGAVRLAYDAYMRWSNDSSRTPQDLRRENFSTQKFSPKKIFFTSYAQFWCSDVGEALVDLAAASDAHPPNPYRVLAAIQNMPEFAAAFRCRNGTRMNPVKKCRVFSLS